MNLVRQTQLGKVQVCILYLLDSFVQRLHVVTGPILARDPVFAVILDGVSTSFRMSYVAQRVFDVAWNFAPQRVTLMDSRKRLKCFENCFEQEP